jgi:two-component system OmpR family response regulator
MKNDLRVLVIDDEEELVSTLVERMTLRGIKAFGALTAQEGLRFLQEQDITVIILDVMMPGMDGLELLKRIKKMYPQIQVILLTGRGSEKESEIGIAEGAFDYLIKPIDIEELIQRMHEAVSG